MEYRVLVVHIHQIWLTWYHQYSELVWRFLIILISLKTHHKVIYLIKHSTISIGCICFNLSVYLDVQLFIIIQCGYFSAGFFEFLACKQKKTKFVGPFWLIICLACIRQILRQKEKKMIPYSEVLVIPTTTTKSQLLRL